MPAASTRWTLAAPYSPASEAAASSKAIAATSPRERARVRTSAACLLEFGTYTRMSVMAVS
jgi:hypothetical protein